MTQEFFNLSDRVLHRVKNKLGTVSATDIDSMDIFVNWDDSSTSTEASRNLIPVSAGGIAGDGGVGQ